MILIPPYIDNIISSAEAKILRLFGESKDLNNWFCLHTLGVSEHIFKREGEIDFVIVGSEGVFVFEIKGGRVKRKDGLWLFTDRYGRITQKKESPFTQARTALYSIRNNLAKKFGQEILENVFGYGVIFPDIVFDVTSPEWDREIIYDRSGLKEPISGYISRLASYWASRQKKAVKLQPELIKEIVDFLRKDFEIVYPVSLDLRESEEQIAALTQEQYRALDAMELNRRLIFSGSAGTGKTLLAIEKARRNNAKGIKTLLICYNRLLGSYLAEVIKNEKLEFVKADSLHQFFYKCISDKGLTGELNKHNDRKDFFSEIYPTLFTKAWQEQPQFMELIIDEGQDILTEKYISALDQVVAGGFREGSWTLFTDPEAQKNMFSRFDPDIYEKLRNISASYRLTVNCRNTKPIAMQAEVVTGYPLGEVRKAKGVPVKYLWYSNSSDQAHQVSEAVNKLLAENVAPEDITILSPMRYQDSLAGSGKLRISAAVYQLGQGKYGDNRGLIGCSTIQGYKGMENSVVILTDIEDFNSEDAKTVNYVGFTRPRSLLIVSADRKLKQVYETYFSDVVLGKVK